MSRKKKEEVRAGTTAGQTRERRNGTMSFRTKLRLSILLVLFALAAVTMTTTAWFSIADNARVRTMSLDIITGVELRIDLDAHETIDRYVKTLGFDQIAARILQEKGFSMEETPLEPVTTSDQKQFAYESGAAASDTGGSYLEFTLHFMADRDMTVHLTSADSKDGASDGTAILSETPGLPEAMRISFAADSQRWVYDPGMAAGAAQESGATIFGLPAADQMSLDDSNAMFSLKEGEDKAVEVHIWLEGTDPACTDDLRGGDYAIRLRFTGTGTDGEIFE